MSPELTVIVTVVEGGAALVRCLDALSIQIDPPAMEVIVPYDDTIAAVNGLQPRFPGVRFLALGCITVPDTKADAFAQHVRYDCRRAGGLRAARGRLVGMLEDRGWPRADWARTMVLLHDSLPHAAVGGAIESGAEGIVRKAVFFCDFGRYEQPVPNSDAEYLSDINICYKRTALEGVRSLWEQRYQEATVNWALRRQGLHLSAQPRVVQQREALSLRQALTERVQWGRTFGQVRGRTTSRSSCILRVAAAPLLPPLLLLRHIRKQLSLGRRPWSFVSVMPATIVLLLFWTIGEAIGELEAACAITPRSNNPGVSLS
ncbi:MAG: hypothetical protein H0T67_10120 [Burkholderiaceae bacterium]|nr:hypothetical protein [Burkholderiaceae bacterium]